MAATDRNPQTTNLLSPLHFKFQLKRAPNVDFFTQHVRIPGFYIPPTAMPNPFIEIPLSGDHITYETLDITFLVDENLTNYDEIKTWLDGLGFPDETDQFKVLNDQSVFSQLGEKSEIVVHILNSAKQPKYTFTFHDAFPIGLSGFEMDETNSNIQYVRCGASFMFRKMDLEKTI